MNFNLDSRIIDIVVPELFNFSLNFIDDLCLIVLSHLGIHLPWLQWVSYIWIVGKIISWVVNLSYGTYKFFLT